MVEVGIPHEYQAGMNKRCKRFIVSYSRPCGNVWTVDSFNVLKDALFAEEAIRQLHKEEGRTSCVFTTHRDEEERGSFSELDLPDIDEHAFNPSRENPLYCYWCGASETDHSI